MNELIMARERSTIIFHKGLGGWGGGIQWSIRLPNIGGIWSPLGCIRNKLHAHHKKTNNKITALPHYSITSLHHYIITTLHHYNIMALQRKALRHYSITALQHYNITALRHFGVTTLHHYIITSLRHHGVTTSRHYSIIALPNFASASFTHIFARAKRVGCFGACKALCLHPTCLRIFATKYAWYATFTYCCACPQ